MSKNKLSKDARSILAQITKIRATKPSISRFALTNSQFEELYLYRFGVVPNLTTDVVQYGNFEIYRKPDL